MFDLNDLEDPPSLRHAKPCSSGRLQPLQVLLPKMSWPHCCMAGSASVPLKSCPLSLFRSTEFHHGSNVYQCESLACPTEGDAGQRFCGVILLSMMTHVIFVVSATNTQSLGGAVTPQKNVVEGAH